MEKKNIVFVAKSIDGFIAGKNGELDWLNTIPNPEGIDMGYAELIDRVDAIVMGRTTYEMVLSFGGDWHYTKHVFVLSNALKEVPAVLDGKVSIIKGSVEEVLSQIHEKGYNKLYIDGGKVVQDFLMADAIDELVLTTMPILLGDGVSLFGRLPNRMNFTQTKTEVFLDEVVQNTYSRKK